MGAQRDAMLRGEPYDPTDPELVADRAGAHDLVAAYNDARLGRATDADRRAILAELFAEVGEGVEIRLPFHCEYGYPIRVGPRTFVNFGAVFLEGGGIVIGADVQVGPNVQLLTPTHPLDPDERRTGVEMARPIAIGDGAWLGGGVIVLPGVTIGAGAVVGAGSVVTRDVPERVVAAGNPCRVIRPIHA
jgi:maltose O-acetyltransferase